MTLALGTLHYFKSTRVCVNILLELALLMKAYRVSRRGSLMTILAGVTVIACTFIFEKLIISYGLFLRNYPTFSHYASLQHQALVAGLILCVIGVIWEITTYRRRIRLSQ